MLEVGIATNTLSTALEPLRKKVTWIEPAPPEMTTVLSMFYTADSEDEVVKATEPHGRVRSYTTLHNGEEAFVVRSRPASWNGNDVLVPASHHADQDYLFSASDPAGSGRPLRLVIFSHPKDGDKMLAWEYGGYKFTWTALHDISTMDTLTRRCVYARGTASKF